MKRFWDAAAAAAGEGGYTIDLDGKPMRLPGGAVLRVDNAAMAEAIAAEWQAAGGRKGGEMSAEDVPLTQLAGTAQERVAPDPAATADAIAKYAETDLLCYRAEHPAPLVAHQAEEWQPWLDWLEREHGAKLIPTAGIAHVAQPPDSLAVIRARLRTQSPPVLAALGVAVPALGSVVLGLALAEGAVGPSRAFELASLDELFQMERWGDDLWAAKRRRDIAGEVALAHRFMAPGEGRVSAKRLRIAGLVQGVGYRDWMVRQANRLGVTGWVRNRGDGTVEALVDGDTAAVEELLRSCRRGPPGASVSLIHEDLVEPEAEPGFRRLPTLP